MDDTILRNKKKQVLYASALFLVIISFLLDDFFRLVFLRLHNGFFQAVFSLFSNISIILFFLFFLTAAMLRIRKDHKWILAMIASILVTFVVTYYLKFFFARPRPNGGVIRTLFGLTDYSFPSFHTSLLFSIIPVLDRSFSHHKILWASIGVMVGLSRLYLGLHYFSDVVFGAILGLIIGELILLSEKKYGWCLTWSKKLLR